MPIQRAADAAPSSARASDTRDASVSGHLNASMAAYQAGNIDAFEVVYHHLRPKLRRYLGSLTLNATLADDLLQETFLQMHRSRHTYLPGRPVEPWAFGIARHVFLMDRRSGIRRKRDQHDAIPDEMPLPEPFSDSTDRTHLQRAVATLPEASREPLLLHHVWGFSFQEVGDLLGLRAGTAKVRAHRAMQQLRSLIRGKE